MKNHFFIFIIVTFPVFSGCLPKKDKSDLERLYEISQSVSDNMSGEELSRAYCSSCHAFADPKLLDRETWKNVLPQMGVRMGIRTEIKDPYKNMSPMDRLYVRKTDMFPEVSIITPEQWYKIKIYYFSQSPEKLPEIQREKSVQNGHPLFEFKTKQLDLPAGGLTTMIRQTPDKSSIYIGDGRNLLLRVNKDFIIQEKIEVPSPPLDMEFLADDQVYITCVGIIHPHDQPLGRIIKMDENGSLESIIDNLKRPVSTTITDLNADNAPDFVFSEYGNIIGELSWYENMGAESYQRHTLEASPGAIQTYVHDFNDDGRTDIISLLAQGNEAIYLFYNQGQNRFQKKQVIQFPPVYGSSWFTINDINRDGHLDIIYVHGDNADYSMILKPYHGMRIYLNNGKDAFTESYFFPMYGASYAETGDFDEDGDDDIVLISFFPDFDLEAPENVIYLENNSTEVLDFSAHAFEGTRMGRWIIISKMDYDLDSDTDLLLGSFTFSPAPTPVEARREWQKENVHIGILENTLH
jgi:hypothetical protein